VRCKVGQSAAVGLETEEVLSDECEGLAGTWTLWNARKGGFFVGFALSVFSKTRAGAESKTCPIVKRGGASEKGLAVATGGIHCSVMKAFENCECK
jgi:hypothetical protein